MRALVLLRSEPLQDPARAHWSINPGQFAFLYKLKIVTYLGRIFGDINFTIWYFTRNNFLVIRPFHLTYLLSPRLVGEVGTRINVRSSCSQQGPAVAWILTQVPMVAVPALLITELSDYRTYSFPFCIIIPPKNHGSSLTRNGYSRDPLKYSLPYQSLLDAVIYMR